MDGWAGEHSGTNGRTNGWMHGWIDERNYGNYGHALSRGSFTGSLS